MMASSVSGQMESVRSLVFRVVAQPRGVGVLEGPWPLAKEPWMLWGRLEGVRVARLPIGHPVQEEAVVARDLQSILGLAVAIRMDRVQAHAAIGANGDNPCRPVPSRHVRLDDVALAREDLVVALAELATGGEVHEFPGLV